MPKGYKGFQRGHETFITVDGYKRIAQKLLGNQNALGFVPSIATRLKRSASMKGKNTWMRGRHPAPEAIRKSVEKRSGSGHWNWKGGISPLNYEIRQSKEYITWRHAVYRRDAWQCVVCGVKCGAHNIIAHHFLPFSECKQYRLDTRNGITLFRSCHYRLHHLMNKLLAVPEIRNLVLSYRNDSGA